LEVWNGSGNGISLGGLGTLSTPRLPKDPCSKGTEMLSSRSQDYLRTGTVRAVRPISYPPQPGFAIGLLGTKLCVLRKHTHRQDYPGSSYWTESEALPG
jgi:hypothetical protein